MFIERKGGSDAQLFHNDETYAVGKTVVFFFKVFHDAECGIFN